MRLVIVLLAIFGLEAATPPAASRRTPPTTTVSPSEPLGSRFHVEPSASPPDGFGCLGADTTTDNFAWHFLTYVQHNVREMSAHAVATRPVAGLPYRPTASVAFVTDSATCAALAMQFAQFVSGRVLAEGDSVYAVTVDSTHYVVTDLRGGSSPTTRRNADGSVTIIQRPMVRDALTIERASGAKVQWLYDLWANLR
jgi:hypothetical protein